MEPSRSWYSAVLMTFSWPSALTICAMMVPETAKQGRSQCGKAHWATRVKGTHRRRWGT